MGQRGADLVFVGGRVFTSVPAQPFAPALAVADGRIVAVDGEDAVRELAGPRTEVVDLAGGLLLPGFQDAHVHPSQAGLEMMRCDLSPYDDLPGYLGAVRAYADARPGNGWLTGGGWQSSAFARGNPTAAQLDTVVADRPVFLANRAHHDAWVNTAALRLAGIDRYTPDPPDGRIERNGRGEPTGALHEGAMDLVGRLVPETTQRELEEALLLAQRHLHGLGITAWQDAILGVYANMVDASEAYLSLARAGRLTARVVGALWWERDRGPEQIDDLVERRQRYQTGRFRATSVKIMQDGVPENFTAAMLDPYIDALGRTTTDTGLSYVEPGALRQAVTALDALDFQVHVHAIGDRAVRETLDAIEVAQRANGGRDNRHHLAHIQIVHPDDVPRFAQVGAVATMQPLWATYEPQMVDLTLPFLGPQRSGWQYPFGGLVRSGARLAAGSDWPVSSPDPLKGIHVAVNRTEYDQPPVDGYGAFLPEQAIDLATALRAYTAGSAYVNHLDETGTLEPGKLADLAVLDRDPFAGPADEIGAARVTAAFVGGTRVT